MNLVVSRTVWMLYRSHKSIGCGYNMYVVPVPVLAPGYFYKEGYTRHHEVIDGFHVSAGKSTTSPFES